MQKPTPAIVSEKVKSSEFCSFFLGITTLILIFSVLVLTNNINFSINNAFSIPSSGSYGISLIESLDGGKKIGEIRVSPFESVNCLIEGKISGLKPGATHSMLILENSNFLDNSFLGESFHFNPTKVATHLCKRDLKKKHASHKGDLGNVIVGSNGEATFEFVINDLNFFELLGRPIVLLNHEDNCSTESLAIQKKEIEAYGIIGLHSESKELEEMEKIMRRQGTLLQGKKKMTLFVPEPSIDNDASPYKTHSQHETPKILERSEKTLSNGFEDVQRSTKVNSPYKDNFYSSTPKEQSPPLTFNSVNSANTIASSSSKPISNSKNEVTKVIRPNGFDIYEPEQHNEHHFYSPQKKSLPIQTPQPISSSIPSSSPLQSNANVKKVPEDILSNGHRYSTPEIIPRKEIKS